MPKASLEEKFAYELENVSHDFHEFFEIMKQTTSNLKQMSSMQHDMRWQFGEPKEFTEFVEELKDTLDGWVSSNC